MLSDDVLYLPVTELARQVKARELSPVELTQSYLARSEKLGPQLNAYVTITRELAMEQAQQAEKEISSGHYRGPLHGIPYAAKDLLAVPGYPTTWGAQPLANQKFDYRAAVIEKLDAAGAVLIGKAAMIELAGGLNYRFASASLTGAAKNPWNEKCWTCGSSSGSAAIVAAALAAFAIGTETWGSIVCPATFCGISGLRPTFGRVSRYGAMALSFSMDKIGPLARSGDDCALVLAAIAGSDWRDNGTLPQGEAEFSAGSVNSRPLRIGWLMNAWKSPKPEVAKAATAAMEVMRQHGAEVSDAHLPDGPWEDAAGVIIAAEGAAAFRKLIQSGLVEQLTDPLGKIGGYINEQTFATDFLQAQRVRAVLQEQMRPLLAQFDVVAAPSLPDAASTLDTNLETDLNYADPLGGIGNLCGLPALSAPCGFTEKGLPIGLLFMGQVRNDAAVLSAGRIFQQNTDWHKRRPPIAQA